MTRAKMALAVVVAVAALMAAVGMASARNLSTSETQFLVVWRALGFTIEGVGTVRCPVIIGGTLAARTITKAEATDGDVTQAYMTEERCTGGRATILEERLPWHIRYSAFSGALPNITGITAKLTEAAFSVEIGGITCLYRSSATEPQLTRVVIAAGGAANELSMLSEGTIRGTGGLCFGARGALSGASGTAWERTGTIRLI